MSENSTLTEIVLPTAKLVLPAGADREQWLEQRTLGVGASDVSGILEIDAPGVYGDRLSVWEDKLGLSKPWEPDQDHPAHWGNVMEPVLREQLSIRLGATIHTPGLFASTLNPLFQFTPDGIVMLDGEPVLCEFKHNSGYGGLKLWADDAIPMHPLVQCQFTMHVSGIKRAIIYALAGGQPQYREIEYSEQIGEYIEKAVLAFWNDYVAPRVKPEPTSRSLDRLIEEFDIADKDADEVEIDLIMARKLIAEQDEKTNAVKDAATALDSFKARMRAIAGESPAVVFIDEHGDKQTLFTLNNDSTFRAKDFAADHPDLVVKHSVTKSVFDAKLLAKDDPEMHRQYRARSMKWKQKLSD